jgi:choline dehydrogenase-like flavoprotein
MENWSDCIPTDPEATLWDVAVVGAGAGGAAAGFNLARLGRSVLFLERGKLLSYGSSDSVPELDRLADASWYAQRIGVEPIGGMPEYFTGFGTGGSTSIYSMTMDRLRPADLKPGCFHEVPPASSVPYEWPIQYEDLEPYYREAEALFRVRGTDDPLTPSKGPLLAPPFRSHVETSVQTVLEQAGLHPYRLHYARERVPGCNGCVGRLCANRCRNDAGRIFVLPALERHGAQILPECQVIRLETEGRSVRQAVCNWNGRRISIRSRIFVLALHALRTPALLLRSANDSFPNGLGNSSGLVGRNLMLHTTTTLSVRFNTLHATGNPNLYGGLSLNDFYVRDRIKLGNVHLHDWNVLTPSHNSSVRAAFQTIVEDFPYVENRVTPKPGSDDAVFWEYRYPDELRFRSDMLLELFVAAVHRSCEISVQEPSGNLAGHACGTCRFGRDPRTSVLDADNRVHELDNAYVLDASFFPSSGGMNPTLTIVANSLRVSGLIAHR